MSALKIYIEVVAYIIDFVNADIIDKELFEGIFDNFCKNCDGRQGMRLRILVNLIKHNLENDEEDYFNFEPYAKAIHGDTFNLFMCILQTVFTNMNYETFKEKLLDYMETDNDNENEYLMKANFVKQINRLIEKMRDCSSKGLFVECVSFTKLGDDLYLYVTFA
jgi:hypothetical protein